MNVKITRSAAGLVLILLMIMITSCGGDDPTTPPQQPATLASISVTPPNPSIAPGTTQQFTAMGTYSNGFTTNLTSQVTWTSSSPAVADISNAGSKGLATATTTTGGTTISASHSGITGVTTLTVSPVASLAVTPANPSSIAPGTTLQFSAIGTLDDAALQTLTAWASWNSSDTAIATVSDAAGSKGLAFATIPGTGSAAITAAYSGATGTATLTTSTLLSIAVTPTAASIPKGTTQQFAATGALLDGNAQTLTTMATWSTSSSGVATISNAEGSQGRTTAVSLGTTTVTALFNGVLSSQATLSVTPAILSSLTVTPVNPSIASGKTRQFAAMGTFTDSSVQDLTSSVDWSSSNTAVATIGNSAGTKGLAASNNTGITGTTTVTATAGSISNSTTLRVTPVVLESISVTPASVTTNGGVDIPFTATGIYTNGTTQNFTTSVVWNSSNTNVAFFNNVDGRMGIAVVTMNGGTTLITATMSGITSNAAVLTVP